MFLLETEAQQLSGLPEASAPGPMTLDRLLAIQSCFPSSPPVLTQLVRFIAAVPRHVLL